MLTGALTKNPELSLECADWGATPSSNQGVGFLTGRCPFPRERHAGTAGGPCRWVGRVFVKPSLGNGLATGIARSAAVFAAVNSGSVMCRKSLHRVAL